MGQMTVGLTVGLHNQLSGPYAAMTRGLVQQAREVEARLQQLGKSGKLSQQQLQQVAISTRQKMAALSTEIEKNKRAYDNSAMGKMAAMTQARTTLGIRGEQAIRKEIEQTRAAYQRLAGSGLLSGKEQARAAQAAKKQIAALNAELGNTTKLHKALSVGKGAVAVGAGVAAAGAVLKSPAMDAIEYDLKLTHMANTGFDEGAGVDRKTIKKLFEKDINDAVVNYGGSRSDTMEALNTVVSAGVVSQEKARSWLPQINKTAVAMDASPNDLAAIGVAGVQSMGISSDRVGAMFNMGAMGSKIGQMELKDMAKGLPAQMAAGAASGLTGEKGFATIVALNEAARATAGTNDEASTNAKNLLLKLNATDTKLDAKKIGLDAVHQIAKDTGIGFDSIVSDKFNKKGKKVGVEFDWGKYLTESANKGTDSVGAMYKAIAAQVGNNPAYVEMQKNLSDPNLKDADRKAAYESMSKIALGSSVGSLIQDAQAMAPLMALLSDPKKFNANIAKVYGNRDEKYGVVDGNLQAVQESTGYKVQQSNEIKDIAFKASIDNFSGAIGMLADQFKDIAVKNPELTGSVVLATGALTAFASVAGIAAIAMGGKGVLTKIPGLAGKITGLAAAGVAKGAKAAVAASTTVAKTAGVAAAAAKGASVATTASKGAGVATTASKGAGVAGKLASGAKLLKSANVFGLAANGASMLIDTVAPDSKVGQYASSALSGAGYGAMAGSLVGPLGTVVGGALGTVGGLAYQAIMDSFADKPITPAAASAAAQAAQAAQAAPPAAPPPQTLQATVKVDMSPDLRAQLAQIKATQQVQATIQAGNASHHPASPAIALRGSIYGGL